MANSDLQRDVLTPGFQRLSTTEYVQQVLRDAVIEGRISQGEQLREVHIAGVLGTGRGAVREAIRQLVQEGLAEYRLHRGVFVRVLSIEDAIDIYGAREAIEVFAAQRVLEARRLPDLSGLERMIREMQRSTAGRKRPSAAVIEADLGFHRELVELAGSRRLTRAYETLAAETRMALKHHPPYPSRDYVRDHERLLVALKKGEANTTELVRQHLRKSANLIAQAMREEADSEPRASPTLTRSRPDVSGPDLGHVAPG
jgi:DNA-binding GntR family transcriptional regulator